MYNAILWKQRRRKELRDKRNNIVSFIVIVLMFLAGIYGLLYGIITSVDASEITPEQMINSGELYKVYCTAYNDSETNHGKSNLRDGKHFKTIEAGECIDLWFNSESEVDDWGKRIVYIQIVRSKG